MNLRADNDKNRKKEIKIAFYNIQFLRKDFSLSPQNLHNVIKDVVGKSTERIFPEGRILSLNGEYSPMLILKKIEDNVIEKINKELLLPENRVIKAFKFERIIPDEPVITKGNNERIIEFEENEIGQSYPIYILIFAHPTHDTSFIMGTTITKNGPNPSQLANYLEEILEEKYKVIISPYFIINNPNGKLILQVKSLTELKLNFNLLYESPDNSFNKKGGVFFEYNSFNKKGGVFFESMAIVRSLETLLMEIKIGKTELIETKLNIRVKDTKFNWEAEELEKIVYFVEEQNQFNNIVFNFDKKIKNFKRTDGIDNIFIFKREIQIGKSNDYFKNIFIEIIKLFNDIFI